MLEPKLIVSHFVISQDQRGLLVYRLLLTNLTRAEYSFRMTLRTRYWQLGRDVSYNVSGHYAYWMDTLQPAGQNRYRGRHLIPVLPHETVRIQLHPERRFAEASIDVHGYVELTIPPVVSGRAGLLQRQGSEPVPVLLHPSQVESSSGTILTSHVGTGYYSGPDYRDAASVTVSSGRAHNEIVPDKVAELELSTDFGPLQTRVTAAEAGDAETVEPPLDASGFMEDPSSLPSVIAYIGHVGEAPETIDSVNNLLREAGHDVRLVRRPNDGGQAEGGNFKASAD